MKLSINGNQLFNIILGIFIFVPIFIGVGENKIYFDVLGKFDLRISKGENIHVFPLNLIAVLCILIFSKPFKLDKDLILLNITILVPLLIYIILYAGIEFRLIKQTLGLLIFFNSYHIFLRFHKTLNYNIKISYYLKLIFFLILILLVVNFISFLLNKPTSLILDKFQIYSFFDYYPLIFFPLLLFVSKFFNLRKQTLLFLLYSLLALFVLYLSQSRTIQISTLIFLLITILIYYFNFIKINLIKKNQLYLSLGLIFSVYFFLSFSFLMLNNEWSINNTIAYRMYEIVQYSSLINLKNFLLPQLTGDVSESFHNQFVETYNWTGIFILYYLYYFKKIINNCFLKNPEFTFAYTIYIFLICILLLPITHIYTGIILAFYFSLLSYKKIENLYD